MSPAPRARVPCLTTHHTATASILPRLPTNYRQQLSTGRQRKPCPDPSIEGCTGQGEPDRAVPPGAAPGRLKCIFRDGDLAQVGRRRGET